MPDINGSELAQHLKRIYPVLKVLFMSGYPADIISRQGILETEAPFIQKPFARQNLAVRLREVIRP